MTIVILGAGAIASAAARQLAASRIGSRVVLVDEAAAVAQGKALDIAQAAPVDGYGTAISGTGDEPAVIGAAVILLADRADGREWADDAGLAMLQRVVRLNPAAPLVCAGTGQRTVIDRGVHELGIARTRLFGTAPEALRAALVSLVALAAETSPRDISLLLVGRPPHEVIVPWEAAAVGGRRALDVLAPPAITRLESRLPQLWPPGPLTLGGAAARVIGSMLVRAPHLHVLDVALTRDEMAGGRAAMLPARMEPGGIARIEPLFLSARDRVRLDSALAR